LIVTNLHLQMIGCNVCGETHEIPRRTMRDQHKLLELRESLEQDHRDCDAYSDRPNLAAASRRFHKDVQRELARSAA
jgi:hypothetical protein